ncbi:MAG: DUF1127 domain-containing protein [Rhodospirillales bacterium]
MTTLTHERFTAVAATAVRKPAKRGLFDGIAATFQLWRRRIDERNALAAFSWRDMSDIGVSQSDVMHELNKPFWKA